MSPLCCDQPETLTQGYYPRVDSPVTESRYPGNMSTTKLTSFSACLVHSDGRAGWSVFPCPFSTFRCCCRVGHEANDCL